MKRILIGAAVMAVAAIANAPAALADSLTCTSNVVLTTINNVVVPDGATCNLLVDTINGNVSVGSGAHFNVIVTTINGNVAVGPLSSALFIVVALNGNYSALNAASTFVGWGSAKNVSFSGGTYALFGGSIGKNVTCDGGASGVILGTTIAGHNSGCTVL
jgi:hypothetical protein